MKIAVAVLVSIVVVLGLLIAMDVFKPSGMVENVSWVAWELKTASSWISKCPVQIQHFIWRLAGLFSSDTSPALSRL